MYLAAGPVQLDYVDVMKIKDVCLSFQTEWAAFQLSRFLTSETNPLAAATEQLELNL
jgi:hypothetical protein